MPGLQPAEASMGLGMVSKIRIGLVGAGWIGSEHGRNVMANPAAELAGIADAEPANIVRFVKASGAACPTFSDYRELLRSDVDAVVIASPNGMHASMCVEAARAGKHIYCEKPMAITLDDCRRVREAVEKAGVKYLIGYHRRLNPLYAYAKNLLTEGRLGTAFMVESDYLHHVPGDWDIWSWLGKEKIAGSLFHAGGGHNVDLIRYFCGEITDVACMKGVYLPRPNQVETEDTALAIFRFAGGAIGKVQFCCGPVVPFTFRFGLYGTKGSVVGNRVWLEDIPRYDQPGHERDGITLPECWIPDNVQGGVSETWKAHMDHFIAMLVSDVPCLNDVASAYQTSIACFAAVRAAKENRVVAMKEMEPGFHG
ncbi:MAG: Gfo/Idh/MocA family oxidoreductase [Planctomycetota bacterium]